jgi:magnesium chelatase accessory protein
MAAPVPKDWPYAAQARVIRATGHQWWVIDTGTAGDTRPVILLLHGAGGSGHSFRHMIPALSGNYRLIVPDLPGQGLTSTRPGARFALETMTRDLLALSSAMGIAPAAIIGHSAGAAIALNLADRMPVQAIVGINAALGKFEGVSGILFPLMARMLAALPLVPQAVSKFWGNPASVDRLLASTGSKIDPPGRAQYLDLVRRADHVGGTLAMMAAWELDTLTTRLPELVTQVLLIAAEDDLAVPARVSREASGQMPNARLHLMPKGGHLVHEVDADAVLRPILDFLRETAPQPSA